MTDWQIIHPDFNEELQKEWKSKGFNYEFCEEWIDAGLKPQDCDFCVWLGKVMNFEPWEWKINLSKHEKLKAEYLEYLQKEVVLISKSQELQQAKENLQSLYLQYVDLHNVNYWKFLLNWQVFFSWFKLRNLEIAIMSKSATVEQLTNETNELKDSYFRLSIEVIEQIKNLPKYWDLTKEQQSLIEKMIPNPSLRNKYIRYRLCEECWQPNTSSNWCWSCNSRHFQQDFENWTSGNRNVDECIQEFQLKATRPEKLLEWIPYNEFIEVEHLAEGGFSSVYKAKWISGPVKHWDIKGNKWHRHIADGQSVQKVVLKSLHDSQNITKEFLQEITYYKLFNDISSQVVRCYGISRSSSTNDCVIVMKYINNGSLRQSLQSNYNRISFSLKLNQLSTIICGLSSIHKQGLVHQDFHSGNILVNGSAFCITDLGLCRPAAEQDNTKVFGVLPYVAPEVLIGGSYTPAADVYSFGMIMYEVLTGLAPYHDVAHDITLALKIYQGLRPNLDSFSLPQLLKHLVGRCWDTNPTQRPTATELSKILGNWYGAFNTKEGKNNTSTHTKEFYQQYQELAAEEFSDFKDWVKSDESSERNWEDWNLVFSKAEEKVKQREYAHLWYNEFLEANGWEVVKKWEDEKSKRTTPLPRNVHSQAVYTSRFIDTEDIIKQLQNSQKINEQYYNADSDSLLLPHLINSENQFLLNKQIEQQAQIQIPPKNN